MQEEGRERAGVEEGPPIALQQFVAGRHVRLVGVRRRDDVVERPGLAGQRLGFDGDRLGRGVPLSWDVSGRDGLLVHPEYRLTGDAIQDVHQGGLAGFSQGGDRPAAHLDVDQGRRRGQVGIPQVVVDRLEPPLQLAGLGVDRDHRVPKQIGPGPVASVVVGRRTADRHVEDPTLLIDRHVPDPDVGPGAAFPAVVQPCLVASLARPGHGVELPQLLARPGVEGARVACRADRQLRHVGADDQDVAVNGRRRVVGHPHVDFAGMAEAGVDLTGPGVQANQALAFREEDPRRMILVAGPVGDGSPGHPGRHGMAPDFLPGIGFQRNDGVADGQVEHAAHDDRRRPRHDAPATLGPQLERPGGRELRDIAGVDLRQRREARPGRIAGVPWPVSRIDRRLDGLGMSRRRQQRGAQRQCNPSSHEGAFPGSGGRLARPGPDRP